MTTRTSIKRTATQLGLKAGDEILMITGSNVGIQGTLEECDGSVWPWFRITKVPFGSNREVGEPIPLHITDSDGNLQFRRVLTKDSEGFIQNIGTKPEVKQGQLVDVLYVDGSLILDLDINSYKSGVAVNTGKEYYASNWSLFHADSSIVAYRFPEDRPAVVVLAKQDTLDELLAELKAELVGVNSHIESLTAELEAAKATKAALLVKVEGHGLQFVGELKESPMLASEARDKDLLRVGSVLLAVTPVETDEHEAGKEYKILSRDEGDSSEFNLESEDGYGWWLSNAELHHYTVVSL